MDDDIYTVVSPDYETSRSIIWNYESKKKYYDNVTLESKELEFENKAYMYSLKYTSTYGEGTEFESVTYYEDIYLVYELDYRKVFRINLTTKNLDFPEDYFNNFKILEYYKYGEYIDRTSVDGFLEGELKTFDDGEDNIYTIEYSIPDDYIEFEVQSQNKYTNRYFGYEKMDDTILPFYNYIVTLSVFTYPYIEFEMNSSKYQEAWYKEDIRFDYIKDVNIDGNIWKHYIGGFKETDIDVENVFAYYVLEFADGLEYAIRIHSDRDERPLYVSEEMLREFTNIVIEKQENL
jgi:hypothetical protein